MFLYKNIFFQYLLFFQSQSCLLESTAAIFRQSAGYVLYGSSLFVNKARDPVVRKTKRRKKLEKQTCIFKLIKNNGIMLTKFTIRVATKIAHLQIITAQIFCDKATKMQGS